jgi:Cro/C1-type HTH DNA-binding domain
MAEIHEHEAGATMPPPGLRTAAAGARPELQPFAKALRDAMASRQMNASDLAKMIWGTVTDPRGYKVAKNRDRIGTYLAGTGYPSRESMAKLCEALGMQASDFPVPTHTRAPREFVGQAHATLSISTEREEVCVISVRPTTISTTVGLKIIEMIAADRERMSKLQ